MYSSCALPGIFEPYERDGFAMDGGMVDMVPLRFAKTHPDVIIAVDLSVKATFKAPNYKNAWRAQCCARSRSPKR